jgi:hypothetical protein
LTSETRTYPKYSHVVVNNWRGSSKAHPKP